ncbi:hypothetical protein WICMUC_000775 [Wickerhamomyces mucosus]|uniref:Uncharacterized protein n=1 Tax=Wickerhamomyces mucosus TaxID=1378264 RepID=A0A9P8PY15_9ASCO|nr:hypothetical protein WICMUC_000775 [Wickerhamomyces mucosus]
MKFSLLIFPTLFITSSLAYSNLALRYNNELIKRDNSSISTIESTSEIVTAIPTTDSNGQLITSTLTYFTTVRISQETQSITTESNDIDSTITSYILTTITLPDSEVSTESIPITSIESNNAKVLSITASNSNPSTTILTPSSTSTSIGSSSGSSSSGFTIINGLKYELYTEADVSGSTTAAAAIASSSTTASTEGSTGSDGTVTVTVTESGLCSATNSEIVSTANAIGTSLVVNKVAIVPTFTLTASNGEIFTISTTTEIDQTSTSYIYKTSTLSSSSSSTEATSISSEETSTDHIYLSSTITPTISASSSNSSTIYSTYITTTSIGGYNGTNYEFSVSSNVESTKRDNLFKRLFSYI